VLQTPNPVPKLIHLKYMGSSHIKTFNITGWFRNL
jgi:hypothetical protein